MEDRAGRGGSRIALGQTEAGRYLRVIYVPDSAGLAVRHHGVRTRRKARKALRRRQKSSQRKSDEETETDSRQAGTTHECNACWHTTRRPLHSWRNAGPVDRLRPNMARSQRRDGRVLAAADA